MSFIEKLFRAIPYLRRPYFQRDAALAALENAKAKTRYGDISISSTIRDRFDQQLWFLLAREDARQDEAIGDFRPYIARMVGKDQIALEIGPSFNPVLPKSAGYAVTVVDHMNQSGLVEKYTPHGVDVSKIESVDVVWTGNSMVEAVGHRKFDAIVAAHVVEHAPDLIQFFKDCSEALSDSGSIYLIVPDKRYSFDFLQPRSDVAKVLSDHRMRRTRHSFESFYRHISASVRNGERIAWDQDGVSNLTFVHGDPVESRRSAERSEISTSYEDEHENYFTPVSFAMIVDELRYLGEIDLELAVLTRPRGSEFLAVLRKSRVRLDASIDEFLKRKMDACRLLLLEDQEQIVSASEILAN
jgi:predicted SAM-dependent methyltransferase